MPVPEVKNVSYDFTGEVVVITGGARGMGRSHALAFAAAGADVVIADICESIPTVPYQLPTEEDLSSVAEEVRSHGGRCLAVRTDIRSSDQVANMIDRAVSEFGKVDILVNNAGIENGALLSEMTEQEWDDMLNIQLKGTFLCARAIVQRMIDARKGRIINIGSVASITAMPRHTHYAAAKHGAYGFTKALALEVGRHNVTVNLVCPTAIDTPMVKGMEATADSDWLRQLGEMTGPMSIMGDGGLLSPQEITNAVLWLASDAANFVTGSAIMVDAGFVIK